MEFLHRVLGLLTLACILACLIDEGASAAATFRIVRRGRRTGPQGGYGGGENSVATAPDLPALYSAPKESPAALYSAPKEQTSDEPQNDALEQGTTTELISSAEDQPQSLEDVGVSEDYIFSTATQVPGGQDTTGPSSSTSSEESSNEAAEVSDKRNSEITAGGGGGYDYQPKPRTNDKGQEEVERANEIISNSLGHQSYFKARDQQQVENQEVFQVQTQAPSPVQEPKTSYEQIVALHQPTRFLAQSENQDLPVARQFGQSQGGYSQRQSEVQQPQSRYGAPAQQQQQQPQQLYQQPRSQPQQLYQQPQQNYQQTQAPQQLYQQPQQQQQQQQPQPPQQLYQQPPQQQYGVSEQTPQPTSYYQPGQQNFQQNYQQQQQQQRQPEQQNAQPEQQPPREYLRQQEYQPQPQYQNPTQPQVQYGAQFNQQQQQQQQQPQYQPQGQQQQRALYQPPSQNNIIQEPAQNKIEEEDTVVLEGLNDNVVDAELLERVQQIIEEHERQQKEELLRLRQSQRQSQTREETPPSVKDNEVFSRNPNEFQVPQSNIYTTDGSIQPTLNSNNDNRQGYDSRPLANSPPPVPAPTQYYARNNEETPVVPQQPQQRNPVEPSRNVPQSYFRQESQGGYQNQQQQQQGGAPEPVLATRNYEEGNRGRALSDNKHIDFQPAILTSHFVESARPNGQKQAQPQNPSAYLPTAKQQNVQPQPQQPFQGYQQPQQHQAPQIAYPEQPQQGDVNSRGLQPAYQVTQPQQPETYFLQQQQQQPQYFQSQQQPQQQQPQYFQPQQQQGPTAYVSYQQPSLSPVVQQQQQQPEQVRPEVQENSLEQYQTPGGYSQTQQVYALPIQQAPAVYQEPQVQQQQQYANYQPEQEQVTPNVITRTIVIHEQPTSVYGVDNNRAIITADDLRGGQPQVQYSQGPVYQQQQQQEQQPQQYQYLTASAQINIAPETDNYQPEPQPLNGGKEITPPRPIYGIPLAPALGPNDNLDSQSSKPNYLPPPQGNSIYEDSSSAQSQRSYNSGNRGGSLPSEGATSVRSADLTNNTPVISVSNTVSLPTREYFPSSESNIEQTTQPVVSLPYGRRIDRHIRKRFSSAVTSPLAGFFSVKTNKPSSSS